MQLTPSGPVATSLLREGLDQFRANEDVLDREWPRLVREHLHRWVAVFDDGQLVTGESLESVVDAIPPIQRDTAVVRYVDDPDRILIL